MNEEAKEVAIRMSDYAETEKTTILKNITTESLLGVCALVVLMILELLGIRSFNQLTEVVFLYCQVFVYYAHSTQVQYDRHSLHSGNMYQIFTYVKNKDAELAGKPHSVSGMLLYAKTDEDVFPDHEYSMSGNKIAVRTLDLRGMERKVALRMSVKLLAPLRRI